MIDKIKQLRVEIDGLSQLTRELKPIKNCDCIDDSIGECLTPNINSKEIDAAVDSLLMSKAWLGKCMGVLGVRSPYKNDGLRKSIEDIEPTADKSISVMVFEDFNHIEKVDYLRTRIQDLTTPMFDIFYNRDSDFEEGSENYQKLDIASTLAYQYLCEARFHLGFELERIRG